MSFPAAPATPGALAEPQLIDLHLGTRRRRFLRLVAIIGGLMVLGLLSGWVTGLLDPARLWGGLATLGAMMVSAMPPDFSAWRDWVGPMFDTLAMSVAATVLSVVLSLPLALCAAPNTAPHPSVYLAARGLMNGLRSVPELIMGIFYVAAFGFGTLPGVLALALHSTGMVAKFFAESIEHVDEAPIEAAKAAGATRLQIITHGVLPQVLPQLTDVTLYRWEYHFRASTVVGLVGAGGIGFQLIGALRLVQYDKALALLIIIFVLVFAIDSLSAWLRKCLK
jgi:phosphonate transport system permease protein